MKHFYLLVILIISCFPLFAQINPHSPTDPEPQLSRELPLFNYARGLGIVTPDSAYSINFRFRMQNRAIYNTVSHNSLEASDLEARTRRLRLRMEGFMYSPKLTYSIQLSFSRGDMDWSVRHMSAINESPNVVRDAVVFYRPNPHWQLMFGQTKLPGNRQRVISSGDQQFVDRSIVNAVYNIDRDFGFQLYYFNQIGQMHYIFKTALTTGDGRNVTVTNPGLSYTGRVELFPFGAFTNMGDMFEGDLEREETVKLVLAGGLSHNEQARRSGAQLGRDLFETRDIQTYIFDALLKYQGFALYLEYIQRGAENPFTTAPTGEVRHIITGRGQMAQASYIFKNDFEIAGRLANISPGTGIAMVEAPESVFTGGVTRYLRRHRLKVQGNLSFHNVGEIPEVAPRNFWSAAFQVELGI